MKISSMRYIDNPDEQKPEGFYLRVNDIRISLGLPFTKLDELISGTDEKVPTRYIECVMRMALLCQVSCDYLFGLTDNPTPYPQSASLPEELDTTRVKILRKERKITLKTISKVIQAATNTYWQKEVPNNRYAFTMYDIVALAQFYKTSTDYLMHLTDDITPHSEGIHEFVPLTVETKLRIQNAMGLTPMVDEGKSNFSTTHFRLKEIRLKKKLTLKDVAETIGVSHGTYEKYEIRPYLMPVGKLMQLADFFCVSLDYLTGRTDKNTWDKGAVYSNKAYY